MYHASIDVYSTLARDIVIDHINNKTSELIGGPATFISAALKLEGIKEHCYVGPVVDVRLEINHDGELGSVAQVTPNEGTLTQTSDAALISTLLREWDPIAVSEIYNEVYLDAQGFVRAPNVLGAKTIWNEFRGDWIKKVRCLKVTALELAYIPPLSLEDQKTRMLLVTKGLDGVDVYVEGVHLSFKPPRIVNAKDTIGAGDTFFAHTVSRVLLGDEPERAIAQAMEWTCKFLENKTLI